MCVCLLYIFIYHALSGQGPGCSMAPGPHQLGLQALACPRHPHFPTPDVRLEHVRLEAVHRAICRVQHLPAFLPCPGKGERFHASRRKTCFKEKLLYAYAFGKLCWSCLDISISFITTEPAAIALQMSALCLILLWNFCKHLFAFYIMYVNVMFSPCAKRQHMCLSATMAKQVPYSGWLSWNNNKSLSTWLLQLSRSLKYQLSLRRRYSSLCSTCPINLARSVNCKHRRFVGSSNCRHRISPYSGDLITP